MTAYQLAQAYVAIVPSMAGVGKQIQSVFGGAASKAGASGGVASGKGFSSGFATKMGAISGLVSTAVSKAASTVSSSLSGAISRVDVMNNFPKIMKNLGYSSSDAAQQIQRMSDKLTGLPTSLDSMVGMVQKIAPLTKNLKSATDISLAFNDALLAGGKSTQMQSDAMEQYSQMLSLNKVDLTAWRSVSNAMPGQMDQLAKSILGTKAKSLDLYEAMKDGTVTFDQFNAAVLKLDKDGYAGFASFSQQAKDATQGIGTAMTNVNTAVTRGVANVINAFGAGSIASAINGFGARITSASNWVSDFVKQTMSSGAVQTFANALSSVGNAALSVVQPIGQALGNLLGFNQQMLTSQGAAAAFSGVLTQAGSALQIVATFIQQNSDWLQPLVVGITAATGAFKSISTAIKVAKASMEIFKALSAAVGGPIGIVVVAIAALVAGLTYFFTQTKTGQKLWGQFTSSLSGVWDQVSSAWNAILPALGNLVSSLMGTLGSVVQAVLPVISSALNSLGSLFSQLLTPITANLPALQTAFSQLGTAFMQVIQSLLPVFTQFVSTMSGLFTQLMPVFSQLASTVGNAIGEIVTTLAPVIATIVTAIAAVIGVLAPVIAMLISQVLPVIGQIIGAVAGLIASIAPFISMLIGMLIPVITAIVNVITALLPIITSVITAVLNVLTPVITAIVGVIQGVVTVLQGVINFVVGVFTGNWSQAWNGIKQIFSGVWQAISSLFTGIWNALTAAIQSGLNVVRTIWSSVWNAVKTFFSTIWTGMKTAAINGVQNIVNTVTGVKDKIVGFFSGAGNWLKDAGKAILDGLVSGLKSTWKNVTNFVGGIGDWIKEHKGPLSYDAKLLIPAGNVIMQGFGDSLEKSFRMNVVPFVSGVNGQLQGIVASNGINAQMAANTGGYFASGSFLTTGGSSGNGGMNLTQNIYTNDSRAAATAAVRRLNQFV